MAPAKKLNTYTYQDYKDFDDSMRCEIIEGEVVMMSPSPIPMHQDIAGKIYASMLQFFKGKKCRPFMAALDIILDYHYNSENSQIILQPDVLVLCDKSKLDRRGIIGAPDLVVEVISPSSAKYDFGKKLELYLAYGVKEYWIVDSNAKTIHLNFEVNKDYEEIIYYADDRDKNIIKSRLFSGLELELNDIFDADYWKD